jgi:hypothetical protein
MTQLPGLVVHINEAKLTGPFELPSTDMQHISYGGRVMVVLVADVGPPMRISETKDGDTKASWTFKAVDAAIVRNSDMRERLADALRLDGLDPELKFEGPASTPPPITHMGVYDNDGTFLGIEGVDPSTGEIERDEDDQPDPRFSYAGGDDPGALPEEDHGEHPDAPHNQIDHNDPHLRAFLNESEMSRVG